MKLGALICPNCSSALSIPFDAESAVCQYCKTQVYLDRGVQSDELEDIKATSERIENVVYETASDVSAIKDLLQEQHGKLPSKRTLKKSPPSSSSEPVTELGFDLGQLYLPGVTVLFAIYIMYLAGFWWGVFVGSLLGLGSVQMLVPNMALPASMWTPKTKIIGWALMLGLIVPLMFKCA